MRCVKETYTIAQLELRVIAKQARGTPRIAAAMIPSASHARAAEAIAFFGRVPPIQDEIKQTLSRLPTQPVLSRLLTKTAEATHLLHSLDPQIHRN